MGLGRNDVEVRFGGSTSDLDHASNRASQDINKVGTAATGLRGVFGRLKDSVGQIKESFKTGYLNEYTQRLRDMGVESGRAGQMAESAFARLKVSAGVATTALIALAAAVVAIGIVWKTIRWGEQFGDMAEKLEQLSARLGMSAREVSQWSALAKTAGMSTDAFAASGQRLERAMYMAANGGKAQARAFQQLGIDITSIKTPSEAFLQIADKFKDMEDGPKKTALAMQLMGRAGANMIPILNQGREAIQAQFETAEKYGAVVSEEFMEAGLAVDNAMDEMHLGMEGLKNMMFEALAPAITAVVQLLNEMIAAMIDSYRKGGTVKVIVEAISIAFKLLVTVIDTVITAFRLLWQVAVTALTGIISTAKALGQTLAALLRGDFGSIKDVWVRNMAPVGNAFRDTYDIGRNYYNRMRDMWTNGFTGTAKPGSGSMDLDDGIAEEGKDGGGGSSAARQAAEEARRIREQALRDYIEDLAYKQELAKENFAEILRLEEEKVARTKEVYGEDSREYIRALREKERLLARHEQDLIKLEQDRLNHVAQLETAQAQGENTLRTASLAAAREHFGVLDQIGAVGNKRRIEQLRQFADEEAAIALATENDIYEIKVRSLQEQLELENLPVEARRALQRELERMEVEHQARLAEIRQQASTEQNRISDQAALQTQARWRNILDPISNAFGNFLNTMATRSASFGQALLTLGDSIVTSFLSMGVQMLTNWIATQIGMSAVTTAQAGVRTATETAAQTAAAVTGAATRVSEVMGLAAVAAAAAFASTAAIPIVGPALAPAAAAAAYGATAAFAPLAVAAKGYDIPRGVNPLVQAHQEEMILPAQYANPLRDMLKGVGPRFSGLGMATARAGEAARKDATAGKNGDANFYYQPNHNNYDASLETLLKREGTVLRRWFKQEVRKGGIRLPAS